MWTHGRSPLADHDLDPAGDLETDEQLPNGLSVGGRLTVDHAEQQARWFLPMAGYSASETDQAALLTALTGRSP